jgi:hypothetical protein
MMMTKEFGRGGELDRRDLTLDDNDDMAEISNAIHEAMEDWVLSVGDIIEIRAAGGWR